MVSTINGIMKHDPNELEYNNNEREYYLNEYNLLEPQYNPGERYTIN